ncbi:MAG TPA: hypothetical protein VEK33_19800 [Terriglobales bacterium]|nr:hypothetical protein [Terriglobales bacterium]
MVKRSGWVTGVVVAHFLVGALFLGACILLLILIRQTKPEENAATTIQGLKESAGILAPLALLVFVGAWGLWKGRLWGWWIASLTDAGLLGIFVYSMIDDGLSNIDWDMAALTVAAFVLVVLVLVPPVRQFYWGRTTGAGGHAG